MNRILMGAATLLALTLLGCSGPVDLGRLSGPSTGSVVLSFNADSRSIATDWTALIHSYSVTLKSQNGFPDRTGSVTGSGTLTLTGVNLGTWDIEASALDIDGNTVLMGTLTGVTLPSMTTVAIGLTPRTAATGSYSYAVRFPTSVGIDAVSGVLYRTDGTAYDTQSNLPFVPVGTLNQVTFSKTGVPSGRYRLELTFSKNNLVYRYLSEIVNIWDSVNSNSWVDPSGAKFPYRTLAAADFKDDNATLDGLDYYIDGVLGSFTLNQSQTAYGQSITTKVPTQSIVFVPRKALAGSALSYSTDFGSTWLPLPTLNQTPSLSLVAGALDFRIRVQAPVGAPKDYRFTITKTVLPLLDGNWKVTSAAALAVQPPVLFQGMTVGPDVYFVVTVPNLDKQGPTGPYRLRGKVTGTAPDFTWTPSESWDFLGLVWDNKFTPVPQTPTYHLHLNDADATSITVTAGGAAQFVLVPWTAYSPPLSVNIAGSLGGNTITTLTASSSSSGSASDTVSSIVWKSSNPSLVSVDPYSGLVTFNSGAGAALLIAFSLADPSISASVQAAQGQISVLEPGALDTVTVDAPANMNFSTYGPSSTKSYQYVATDDNTTPPTEWNWVLDGAHISTTAGGATSTFVLDIVARGLTVGPHTLSVEATGSRGLIFSNNTTTNSLDFVITPTPAPNNPLVFFDHIGRFTSVTADKAGNGFFALGVMGTSNLPFMAQIGSNRMITTTWGTGGLWMPSVIEAQSGRYFGNSLGLVQNADRSFFMSTFSPGDDTAVLWKTTPQGETDWFWGTGSAEWAGSATNSTASQQRPIGRPVQDSVGNVYVMNWVPTASGYLVYRNAPNGSVDTGYNGLSYLFPSEAQSIAIQKDDKVLVTGHSAPGYVARLLTSGSIDTGFGSAGYAYLPSPYSGACRMDVVFVAPSGAIYAAGYLTDTNQGFIARFTSTGAPDYSFNSAGAHPGVYELPANYSPNDLAMTPGGELIVIGTTAYANYDYEVSTTQAFVAKLLPGLPLVTADTTFQASGFVVRNDPFGSVATGVAVDSTGQIAVAGFTKNINEPGGSNTTPGLWFYR